MTRTKLALLIGAAVVLFGAAFAVGFSQARSHPTNIATATAAGTSTTTSPGPGPGTTAATAAPTATTAPPTTTLPPCGLSATGGSVPVDQVCSSAGAPHFDTPEAAMKYLAKAWNSGNVEEVDYVTDPYGRMQLDAMAAQMPDLHFSYCQANPAGDYTCYFHHRVVPSTSPTTYPNPEGYPAGEAVFTVAPASGPGWYLTVVQHCG